MVICVQLAHFSSRWLKGYIYSSCYYHHHIGSIHLSHCHHIFPWLCAWDVCYITFCHLLHIRYGKKTVIRFHYYCAVYDECKYSDPFWLADRTRWFVQYTISLPSLCKLIWRHWTYKMPARYILSGVWVRLSMFSPLSIIQYVGLYVFSWTISLVMIEINMRCLIIIIKSEVWTITHCLVLGHETMVSALCRSIFLWKTCLISAIFVLMVVERYILTLYWWKGVAMCWRNTLASSRNILDRCPQSQLHIHTEPLIKRIGLELEIVVL